MISSALAHFVSDFSSVLAPSSSLPLSSSLDFAVSLVPLSVLAVSLEVSALDSSSDVSDFSASRFGRR